MKLYQVVIVGLVCAAFVGAGQIVDQGQPGRQGAWPVSLASGNNSVVPTPSSSAWLRTSLSTTVASNGTPCTTAGGASCTNIYGGSGGVQWVTYQNLTLWVVNSGANTLDNVLIEWSPDGATWELWDTTTFAGLTAGSVRSLALTGNSRYLLRLEGRSGSGTTITVYVDATSQAY